MGCVNGKISDDEQDVPADGIDIKIHDTEETKDFKVIENIKKSLRNHPERFLLNNLLMSFVFFKNYQKDFYDFSNTTIPKEELDLDAKLNPEVKKCILPGVLLEKIQKNVKFLREHHDETMQQNGEKEITILEESLSDKSIYVVNNNIEVIVVDDGNEYTPITVPGCRVKVEEIIENLGGRLLLQKSNEPEEKKEKLNKYGFLRLRVIPNSNSNMNKDQLIDRKECKPPQTNEIKKTKKLEESLVVESDEYSEIIEFNTPKKIIIKPTTGRRETLPNNCFKTRQIKKVNQTKDKQLKNDTEDEEEEDQELEDDVEDEEEEDEEKDKDKETDVGDAESHNEEVINDDRVDEKLEPRTENLELFEDVTYLSSKGFLEYFQSEVFPNTVGRLLGFSEDEIENSKLFPGYIVCDRKGDKYKIIPAVSIEWPRQAEEFIDRKSRKVLYDSRRLITYKWPKDSMIEDLKVLDCMVIPKGFVHKKDVKNPDSDIEWEIHFPKAERFLEMRLSHPQVRCYIFLIALFKTFIEKFTTHRGLVLEHIRTHIFWECEEDAMSWPEHKMGIKILKVIEDLNSGLSRRNIPDYFIKDKNIFENIPSMYIQFAQKIFHDVLQFPVMHFLEALRNLKFLQEDFYPAPDLNELEYLLTNNEVLLPKVTRTSSRKLKKPTNLKKKYKKKVGTKVSKQKNKLPANEDREWKRRNEMNNRIKYINNMNKKIAEEAAKAAKAMEENRNLKISFTNLEVLRQKGVLEFFIKHFIQIARKSKDIGPLEQSHFYIKQAWYNWNVLVDLVGESKDTKEIENTIRELHNEILSIQEKSTAHKDIAPPTPRRNKGATSSSFNMANSEKIVKTPKVKLTSVSDPSSSIITLNQPPKEKRVAFDDNVEVSAC